MQQGSMKSSQLHSFSNGCPDFLLTDFMVVLKDFSCHWERNGGNPEKRKELNLKKFKGLVED